MTIEIPSVITTLFQNLASGAITLEEYQDTITGDDVPDSLERWLHSLKSSHPDITCHANARMILVCAMITYHLEELVDDTSRKPHQKIYSQALHTMDVIDNYPTDSVKLLHALHQFSRHFRVWKKVDRFKVVEEYAKLYWELEVQKMAYLNQESENKETDSPSLEKTNQQLEIDLAPLEERQEKIRQTILESAGPEGLEQLEQYTPVMMDMEAMNKIKSEVTTSFQKAYWDNFKQTIDSDDWSYFSKLLEEILYRFQAMVPRRKDVQEELQERLSYNHQKESPPSLEQAREWGNYMVEMMGHFQAPSEEEDRDKFWEKLQNTLPFGREDLDSTLGAYFSMLFEWVMTRQDIIFQQIMLSSAQKKNQPKNIEKI